MNFVIYIIIACFSSVVNILTRKKQQFEENFSDFFCSLRSIFAFDRVF